MITIKSENEFDIECEFYGGSLKARNTIKR